MAVLRAPNLTITVQIADSKTTTIMTGAPGKRLELNSHFNRPQLLKQHEKLRTNLEQFKQLLGQSLWQPRDVDWGAVDNAMRLLLERGRRFAYQVFGDGNGPDVEEFCRVACHWNLQRWANPFVEVDVDESDVIPFEFMPLFRIKEPARIKDFRSLDEAARGILGFSAIVKRRLRVGRQQPSMVLKGAPRLSVRMFQFASLEVVDRAQDYFRKHGVQINGPWPTESMPSGEFVDSSCEHIWDFRKSFDTYRKPQPDQIYYFGCHCETGDDDTEDYAIELSHDGVFRSRVTLGQMQSHFLGKRRRHETLPLVFMNACGSAVEPAGVAAFPAFFIAAGYRGYIGTEANIPDGVAAEFARQFYSKFLNSVPLGQSMLDARRALLRRHANPLGILYTAYADPEMQVLRS